MLVLVVYNVGNLIWGSPYDPQQLLEPLDARVLRSQQRAQHRVLLSWAHEGADCVQALQLAAQQA